MSETLPNVSLNKMLAFFSSKFSKGLHQIVYRFLDRNLTGYTKFVEIFERSFDRFLIT